MKKYISLILLAVLIAGTAFAQDLSGYKICINAGHGGHDSNDRPPVNSAGFWESEGNITKALVLETILKEMGATVYMTRRNNRTNDDWGLSSIGQYANSNNCDWMHSIHSNGWQGTSQYTLLLFPGPDGDPRINGISGYPSAPEELTMANIMAPNIKAALQTSGTYMRGDWSFYGTGQPYLGVFRSLQVPGTLSEGTFHDYYPESYRLQNLDFRINEAWAIALSFVDLYNKTFPDFANLSGIVRTKDENVSYYYRSGSNDQYKPVDSIEVTVKELGKTYYGNTSMYVDKYTPQWSKAGSTDYYTNGANNNDGNNHNNGFFLFDSLDFGTYTLIFDAPGFWKDSTQVTISDSKFFWTQNFFMESSVPPYVKSFTPVQNEAMHPAWEPVVLTFSHAMDTSAFNSGFSISPAADLDFTWNSTFKSVSVSAQSDSLDVETDYSITLDADSIRGNRDQKLDGNGDGVGGDDFVLTFTTSPMDIYGPEVVDFYPPKAATFDDLQPIVSFVFNETVDTSRSDLEDKFSLIKTSGSDIEWDTEFAFYQIGKQTIVSLFPQQEMVRGWRHARYAYSGIYDLYGNVSDDDQASSLKIDTDIPYYADTVMIDNFNGNFTANWKQPTFSGSNVNLLDGLAEGNSRFVNLCNGSTQSMKLYYKFDAEQDEGFMREWVNSATTPGQKHFTNEGIMQAWVFGDGSGNLLRFCVDDPNGTGSHEVSPWYAIDYIGWHLLKWDMRAGVNGEWEPGVLSDGNLDGSLNYDSFQMMYVDSLGNNEGSIYIEDLMVVIPGGVAVAETDLPQNFTMAQNYPNPFNPQTTIDYTLPEKASVSLDIYDVNGSFVANLVKGQSQAGSYSVKFNGENLSGGIYISRLTVNGSAVAASKMLLVK